MSFIEIRESFGEFTKVTVRQVEGANEISIIPEMGARLNHFQVNLHGESVDIVGSYPDATTLKDEVYAKSSLLAPFPNRIADGKYTFKGQPYQLDINRPHENNAIHGFVSNKAFQLLSSVEKDDYYELVFEYTSAGDEGYPFPFILTVTYRFGGVWLEIDTALKNIGKSQMPAGFGWHPYIRTGGQIDNTHLLLPEVEKIEVDERLIPTGEKSPYSDFSNLTVIGTTEFDTGFHLLGFQPEVQLFDESRGIYITLSMTGNDNKYKYLQVYTPPWRDAIAIEPMTCAADAFNNGWGLCKLSPGKTLQGSFTILVS